MTARTSSELRILYSLPPNLISVPPYLVASTRSPFLTSKGTFLPLSSVLPVPTATTRLSMGFSLAVSGMMIPPFLVLSSFSSTGSTRIRSPVGLTFSIIFHFPFVFCINCKSRLILGPMLRLPAVFCCWPSQGDNFRHIKAHFVLDDFAQGDVRCA